jgi:hypothetical protein
VAGARRNVLLHCPLRRQCVLALERIQYLLVLATCLVEPVRGEVSVGHGKRPGQEPKHARYSPASSSQIDCSMEVVIEALLGCWIDLSPHGRMQGHEVLDISNLKPRHSTSCCEASELAEDLVVIGDVFSLQRSDEDTLSWQSDDKAFLIQCDEGFADGESAHTEFLGDSILFHAFARAHSATQDLLSDVTGNFDRKIATLTGRDIHERSRHDITRFTTRGLITDDLTLSLRRRCRLV